MRRCNHCNEKLHKSQTGLTIKEGCLRCGWSFLDTVKSGITRPQMLCLADAANNRRTEANLQTIKYLLRIGAMVEVRDLKNRYSLTTIGHGLFRSTQGG